MVTFKKIVLFMILIVFSVTAYSAPQIDQAKAKVVIMKTNRAIGVAHMTVKRTANYTGKLGLAVKHARYAKKMYEKGEFDKSAQHSLYARKLATEIMRENNAKTGSDNLLSADETTILNTAPSEADLVDEVTKEDAAVLKDEELLVGKLGIEVK